MATYNYSKLLGRIREKGYTQASLCDEIRMNRSAFTERINSKRSFRQSEIENICCVLDIEHEEISRYFFAH